MISLPVSGATYTDSKSSVRGYLIFLDIGLLGFDDIKDAVSDEGHDGDDFQYVHDGSQFKVLLVSQQPLERLEVSYPVRMGSVSVTVIGENVDVARLLQLLV